MAAGASLRQPLDVTGNVLGFAFVIPRNITITDISSFFSVSTATVLLGTKATVSIRLLSSPMDKTNFIQIPTAEFSHSPPFTDTVQLGSTASVSANSLDIQIPALSRILILITLSAEGLNPVTSLAGFVGGSFTFTVA
jgi:BclB C-terminal domain-containing protein